MWRWLTGPQEPSGYSASTFMWATLDWVTRWHHPYSSSTSTCIYTQLTLLPFHYTTTHTLSPFITLFYSQHPLSKHPLPPPLFPFCPVFPKQVYTHHIHHTTVSFWPQYIHNLDHGTPLYAVSSWDMWCLLFEACENTLPTLHAALIKVTHTWYCIPSPPARIIYPKMVRKVRPEAPIYAQANLAKYLAKRGNPSHNKEGWGH